MGCLTAARRGCGPGRLLTVNGAAGSWAAEKFDRRATSYDRSAMHHWQAQQAAHFLAGQDRDRRVGRVLDVATGTGLGARKLTLMRPAMVVGIDVSQQMLRQARRVSDPTVCRYLRADTAALPFRAGVFDAVLCVAAMPYFPDPAAALAQWRRVCRSDGQAVLTVAAAGGITSSRLLREAAAGDGITLADAAGPLADPVARARLTTRAGWLVREVRETQFVTPVLDTAAAFAAFLESGFAEPLRTAPPTVRQRVRERFEALYRDETAEHHRVLLIRLGVTRRVPPAQNNRAPRAERRTDRPTARVTPHTV